jgi:hypothetical protein
MGKGRVGNIGPGCGYEGREYPISKFGVRGPEKFLLLGDSLSLDRCFLPLSLASSSEILAVLVLQKYLKYY